MVEVSIGAIARLADILTVRGTTAIYRERITEAEYAGDAEATEAHWRNYGLYIDGLLGWLRARGDLPTTNHDEREEDDDDDPWAAGHG